MLRSPENVFANVPHPIQEPSNPLYPRPKNIEHSLSEEGKYLLDSEALLIF